MQPVLASAITANPPTGRKLIQQPGRWPPKCIVP